MTLSTRGVRSAEQRRPEGGETSGRERGGRRRFKSIGIDTHFSGDYGHGAPLYGVLGCKNVKYGRDVGQRIKPKGNGGGGVVA